MNLALLLIMLVIGIAIVIVGVLILVLAIISSAKSAKESNVEYGGVLVIGPLPIIFGSKRWIAIAAAAIAIALMALTITLYSLVVGWQIR